MSGLYTGYAIELHTVEMGVSPAAVIGAQISQNIATNTETQHVSNTGNRFASVLSITAQNPTATFSTNAIKDAFDAIGTFGIKITADGTHDGLSYYEALRDDDGNIMAGAVHRRKIIKKGLLHPVRLSVDHQQDAQADFMIVALYDGTNDPVTVEENVSLPTVVDTDRWTYNSMIISTPAVDFDKMRSFSIDWNMNVEAVSVNSDIWPTCLNQNDVLPRVSYRGLDVDKCGDEVDLRAIEGVHADSTVYLRKRDSCKAQFVADGTAEHIKLTINGCAYIVDALDANRNESAEWSIEIPLTYDGTNDPLTIDTASAIT